MATVLVDAGDSLREIAQRYTDDLNEAHLLTHGAVVWLLRREAAFGEDTVPAAALKQAFCASRRARSVDWTRTG